VANGSERQIWQLGLLKAAQGRLSLTEAKPTGFSRTIAVCRRICEDVPRHHAADRALMRDLGGGSPTAHPDAREFLRISDRNFARRGRAALSRVVRGRSVFSDLGLDGRASGASGGAASRERRPALGYESCLSYEAPWYIGHLQDVRGSCELERILSITGPADNRHGQYISSSRLVAAAHLVRDGTPGLALLDLTRRRGPRKSGGIGRRALAGFPRFCPVGGAAHDLGYRGLRTGWLCVHAGRLIKHFGGRHASAICLPAPSALRIWCYGFRIWVDRIRHL